MKKVWCILLFCVYSDLDFAGCSVPIFYTDNGIYSSAMPSGSFTVYVSPGDSFNIVMHGSLGGSCDLLRSASISFNNTTINTSSSFGGGYFRIKLPCTPGIYRFSAENILGYKGQWNVLLNPKPIVSDSNAVDTSGAVSQTTSLSSAKILNPNFLFYPNPAHETLTLQNESETIRTVTFYDAAGQLLSKYEIYDTKAIINLDKYEPGIYQVSVATLSDKIIIKRISIL